MRRLIVRGKGLVRDRLPLLREVGEALTRYLQTDGPATEEEGGAAGW